MYDAVIIGAGPAGMTAGIYAARAELQAVVLESGGMSGGQIVDTAEVDNYPGLKGMSGYDLAMKLREHCDALGVVFADKEVCAIEKEQEGFCIHCDDGEEMHTRTVLLATGAKHRKLMIPGEEELTGSGVSYCATCDGAFFRGREVAVVGGGDVAIEDALFLARICKRVTLIHRREEFRAAKTLVNRLRECDNVDFVLNAVPQRILGSDVVEGIEVSVSGELSQIKVAGVFIAVGMMPSTELVKDIVTLSEGGYVLAGEDCQSSVKGIYVAGDVRTKPLRQVVTAAADGAVAIYEIERYLSEKG